MDIQGLAIRTRVPDAQRQLNFRHSTERHLRRFIDSAGSAQNATDGSHEKTAGRWRQADGRGTSDLVGPSDGFDRDVGDIAERFQVGFHLGLENVGY